jgi:hypothetical protein
MEGWIELIIAVIVIIIAISNLLSSTQKKREGDSTATQKGEENSLTAKLEEIFEGLDLQGVQFEPETELPQKEVYIEPQVEEKKIELLRPEEQVKDIQPRPIKEKSVPAIAVLETHPLKDVQTLRKYFILEAVLGKPRGKKSVVAYHKSLRE